MSLCCPNCFRNETAKAFILENGEEGNCGYCQAEETTVIEASELKNLFLGVVNLYQPLEHGENFRYDSPTFDFGEESLAQLLNGDWQIFNDDLGLEWNTWEFLMDDIWLGGMRPKDASYEYPPSDEWVSMDRNYHLPTPEDEWDEFAYELKHGDIENYRDEPSTSLPDEWLPHTITSQEAERIISTETALYRGRRGYAELPAPNAGRVPFPLEQMGAPPADVATAGRANVTNEPVLYAAFDQTTATYESGRFPGSIVSVRKAFPTRELRIINLTHLRGITDPLGEEISLEVFRHIRFLNRLNEELSRPIHPDDSELEYKPTQYLANLIESLGYDGISYRSSLNSEGENLVIFDTNLLNFTEEAHLIDIESVSYGLSDPYEYCPPF